MVKAWNATLTGNYLWTNTLSGEIFPTAMTPSSWSVWEELFSNLSMGDVPAFGNIAGRPYLNYSVLYSFLLKLLRTHERVMDKIQDSIGAPPAGVEIPRFPVSWRTILFQVVPTEFRKELKKARLKREAPAYLAMVRDRCRKLGRRIEKAQRRELVALWRDGIRPLWHEVHCLQDKMNEDLQGLTQTLKSDLTELLGEDGANALLTTMTGAGELASLGPLVGLAKVRIGELSREAYLGQYGHRGPRENELAEPRPYEDPDWIDRQLAESDGSLADVGSLLRKRDAEFAARRKAVLAQLPPRKAREVARSLDEVVQTNRTREATRAELTRVASTIRGLFLRAGELTGLGNGVFFLTVDELAKVLDGDDAAAAQVPTRREAYEQYKALPSLPAWIRGRFDPFEWAADPNRRADVFSPGGAVPAAAPATEVVVRGHPGSAGLVAGLVRRIDSPDEGERLQRGEILVTRTTNVGWTPLFPRAAAVVTDVGGSLSHAAIVARELGIPAVVGCGDATVRLQSGDRVRVDGGRGTVEILEAGHGKE